MPSKFHVHVRNLLIRCITRNCRVGIKLPTVEVRFNDLSVEAECQVIHGKPIPTLWNTIKGILSVSTINRICYIDMDMERFAASMFFLWLRA